MFAQSDFVLGNVRRGASRFASSCDARYPVRVAETAASGRGTPSNRSAQPRRAAFLCVPPLRAFFYGWALVGTASAVPVPSVAGVPTLPMCPPTPVWNRDAGLNVNRRGRTMRQSTHAHTGPQPQVIQSIIRRALRDAATADTYQSALDATGAALAAIAALVRAEVRHG